MIDLNSPVLDYYGRPVVEPQWLVPPQPDRPGIPRRDESGNVVTETVCWRDVLFSIVERNRQADQMSVKEQVRAHRLLGTIAKDDKLDPSADDVEWIVRRAVPLNSPLVLCSLCEAFGIDPPDDPEPGD